MNFSKCKNSVFCGKFLVFFLMGTICGVWLFRCLDHNGIVWLTRYCILLEHAKVSNFFSAALSWIRPLVPAALIAYSSWAHQLLPILIVLRGVLTSYSFCAINHSELSPGYVVFRGILLLPVFYWLCRYIDEFV